MGLLGALALCSSSLLGMMRLRSQRGLGSKPSSTLAIYTMLGKSLNSPLSQFPYLSNGNHNSFFTDVI